MEIKEIFLKYKPIFLLVAFSILIRSIIFYVVVPYAGILPPVYPDLEPYQDFKNLYLPDVDRFLEGEIPYKDFWHAYPPLFLYSLTLLSLFTLPAPYQAYFLIPALFTTLLDSLIVIPVYLIAKKLNKSDKQAFIISLIFTFSPLILWYDSALWLNHPWSTLLMMLSLYFYLDDKPLLSASLLGIAASFKQTAGIILPVLLIVSWRNKDSRSSLLYLLFFFIPFFISSLPWVLLDPYLYIWALGFPGLPTPDPYLPPVLEWSYTLTDPANITMYLGIHGFVDLSLKIKQFLPILFAIICSLSLFSMSKIKSFSNRDIIYYSLHFSLVFYTFLPRGLYKYYFVGILPLLALLIVGRKTTILYEILNIVVLWMPRFLTPWITLFLIPATSFIRKDYSEDPIDIPDNIPDDDYLLSE